MQEAGMLKVKHFCYSDLPVQNVVLMDVLDSSNHLLEHAQYILLIQWLLLGTQILGQGAESKHTVKIKQEDNGQLLRHRAS